MPHYLTKLLHLSNGGCCHHSLKNNKLFQRYTTKCNVTQTVFRDFPFSLRICEKKMSQGINKF